MVNTPDPLIVEPATGTRWRLDQAMRVRIHTGRTVEVPADFVTDFASVPRLLWWLYPPHDHTARAAALHDYLYRTGMVSRAVADLAFLEVMLSDGVRPSRAWAMYYAVRAFGWIPFRRYRSKPPTNAPSGFVQAGTTASDEPSTLDL